MVDTAATAFCGVAGDLAGAGKRDVGVFGVHVQAAAIRSSFVFLDDGLCLQGHLGIVVIGIDTATVFCAVGRDDAFIAERKISPIVEIDAAAILGRGVTVDLGAGFEGNAGLDAQHVVCNPMGVVAKAAAVRASAVVGDRGVCHLKAGEASKVNAAAAASSLVAIYRRCVNGQMGVVFSDEYATAVAAGVVIADRAFACDAQAG